MNYTFTNKLTHNDFDEFAQAHPHGTFFQSSQWAGVKDHWTPIYTGVYKDKVLVAAALVLKRKLVFNYSFMYAPRGPLLDFKDEKLLMFYLDSLKNLAKEHSAISLTIDPYIKRASYLMSDAMSDDFETKYYDEIANNLEKNNYIKRELGLELHDTIQPRFQPTIYFDEQNTYLNSRGYKYGLKALENNVKTRRIGAQDLDQFIEVIEKTEDYKNINLRGKGYFEKLINQFQEKSLVSIAYLDMREELLSLQSRKANMKKRLKNKNMRIGRRNEYENQLRNIENELQFIQDKMDVFGDTINIAGILGLRNDTKAELLYAGMNRDFQKYLPSNLNYVDAINWAKDQGCESVCFGGSTGHYKDGISRYKVSFNPTLDEYIGEFVYVNKKILNFTFNKLLELREKIRYRPKD